LSEKHPIIVITGSSGAGTTTVRVTFEEIFRREGVTCAVVEGDAFHRYDRAEMKEKMAEMQGQGHAHFSHFGPDANLFEELEALFRQYSENGRGKVRKYLHDEEEALAHGLKAGMFTPWEDIPANSDVLFYEGLHGAVKSDKIDVARYADLLIGIVPSINLEWIQKLHRDKAVRGQSHQAVVDTISRRMPDYVNYVCPQFSETPVNFQRVPVVDTSNPFSARHIPSADESMLIIRFRDPRGVDFPLFAFDAGGQLHVESKYHCLSGRKDAACDAAHFHADNLEVDRSQASDNGEIVRQATDWSSKPPIWRVLKLLAL
jgi:phosphoribulokinase